MSGDIRQAHRRRVTDAMRKRGWHHRVPCNGLRARAYALAIMHHPWYDWGHRLMVLVGRDEGGTWSEPRPPTWWYRQGPPTHMARTKYPRHPRPTYQVVKDYDQFRALTEGLNEDEMYPWNAICVDQDGELQLGKRYWGGPHYGLSHWDIPILRSYLRHWRRLDWFGLRSWLFSQGLHACVHVKKPGACNATPPHGAGGYDHWHCRLKRGHSDMHRFNAYVWGEIDGEVISAHVPEMAQHH